MGGSRKLATQVSPGFSEWLVKTVLFVCDGNTFRSVMAEAIFNAHPASGWIAESAGVAAGQATSPAALELLRAIGVSRRPLTPRTVTAEQLEQADYIIVFGCKGRLPGEPGRTVEDWAVPGGMGKTDDQREGIRDEIKSRVEALVARLSNEPG